MTTRLCERMGAVADELEVGAVTPEPEGLWRAGARRRLRRRVAAGGGALVAVLMVALVLAPSGGLTVVPAGGDGEGVRGHPQRIGHQWWTPGLGDRPGPVAGLVQSVDQDSGHTEWLAVMPGGGLRRLPADPARNDSFPSVSDDGSVVGYLSAPNGPYVLHNLVTGRRVEFGDITDNAIVDGSQPGGRWWTSAQTPSWFSSDGSHLALAAGSYGDGGAVLLGIDGSETPLPGVESARIAGWRDNHTLVGVTAEAPLTLWTYDVDARHVELGAQISPSHIDASRASQWTFRWSRIAQRLVYETVESDGTRIGLVDPDTGAVESTVPMGGDSANAACGPVLTSAGAAANADRRGSTALVVPQIDGGRVVATTDPAIGAQCILWAEDALAGEPAWTAWGTNGGWWTWWWRELVVGLLLVGLGVVVLARRVRARRRAALVR